MASAPRTVTRFVLIADGSGPEVIALVEPYAPDLLLVAPGADEALRGALSLREVRQAGEADLRAVAESIAAEQPGASVAILADAAQLRSLLCTALGVPAAASQRFQLVPDAVSLLELDGESRWAVVRLNEGRPLPGEG